MGASKAGSRVERWLARVEAALAQGDVVLVPGETAARLLRLRLRDWRAGVGATPADVMSVGTWLSGLWSAAVTSGADGRLLLNAGQELLVWTEVVAAGPRLEGLQSAGALAELAMSAWGRAARFLAVGDELRALTQAAVTHDARMFSQWAAVFRERCVRESMLTQAELADALRGHAAGGGLGAARGVTLIGFGAREPAFEGLLGALAASGWSVRRDDADVDEEGGGDRGVVSAATPEEERRTAARWIREFLEGRGAGASVALVVPGLDDRDALEAVLRAELAPELQDVGADVSSLPFAFAQPTALAGTALAMVAMDLLRWIAEPLPLERVSALLVSPYVGAEAEMAERAGCDAFELRQTPRLRPEVGMGTLAALARTRRAPAVAALVAPLLGAATQVEERGGLRTFAEWMEFARGYLRAARWPGERALNPQDFADVQAWEHQMDGVATLDFADKRVDWATALQTLERAVADAARGVPSGDAAVTVLTAEQARGACFDAVVFLHANDTQWPVMQGAHPLLGRGLQKERGMPGVDAARTTEQAVATLHALADASDTVLVMYAREDQSGHQRLSPLVTATGWAEMRGEDLIAPTGTGAEVNWEIVDDVEPLPALLSAHVRGGARVLQMQAQCGFRAFAEMRLFASGLEPAGLGMDARQSGIFLHGAMDSVWQRLGSQDVLRAMGEEERRAVLAAAVEDALPAFELERPWDGAYLAVQKERLRRLLLKWMERELDRGPFRVAEKEHDTRVQVGPLELDLRVDRMDEIVLADGTLGTVLVDYKSGASPGAKDWEGARPDDPQLPLYAMLPEAERLQALMFAKVRASAKERKWLGYSAVAGVMPKPADMPFATLGEQVDAWRQVLGDLAEEFAEGRAAVSPKEWPGTCVYCEQRLLCRLDAAALRVQADALSDLPGDADAAADDEGGGDGER